MIKCPKCNYEFKNPEKVKGGKKSKKGKRNDLKKGGSTYNKIHGKKGEGDEQLG